MNRDLNYWELIKTAIKETVELFSYPLLHQTNVLHYQYSHILNSVNYLNEAENWLNVNYMGPKQQGHKLFLQWHLFNLCDNYLNSKQAYLVFYQNKSVIEGI